MWECPKCGEEHEQSSDTCWNCGTFRDGTENADFQTADDPSLDLSKLPPDEPIASPTAPKVPDQVKPAKRRRLDEKMVQTIQDHLSSKTTEDLQAIWVENDRKEYSREAFEAIRQLLLDRGEKTPEQRSSLESDEIPKDIPNHLTEAILVTVFCCLPLGIVAIIYAAEVNTLLAAGDRERAFAVSETAGKWCAASFIIGLVGLIVYVFANL